VRHDRSFVRWKFCADALDNCPGGGRNDTARAQAALAELCQTYWYPLYAFIRHRGHAPHDAQDLTQEFFARLLENNCLAEITRERGKFRSFLLVSVKEFFSWTSGARHSPKKRGGGRVVSLDAADAESRFAREPVDAGHAGKAFRTELGAGFARCGLSPPPRRILTRLARAICLRR